MKIAINYDHTGKYPEKFHTLTGKQKGYWWRLFNGGFTNMDLNYKLFANLVKIGYAYTSQHLGFRSHRNFICGQHVAIDFDTGDEQSSFESLKNHPLIANYATLLHSTPSHKDDAPKSRAFFMLERPMFDIDQYSWLLKAINMFVFKEIADARCHDPARFFFGSNGNVEMLGHILPFTVAYSEIIVPYNEHVLEQEKIRAENLKNSRVIVEGRPALLQAVKDRLIQKVLDAAHGEKHVVLRNVSRTFGGYVANGYFDEREIEAELKLTISQRQIEDLYAAYSTITKNMDYGKTQPLSIYDNTYTVDDLLNDVSNGNDVTDAISKLSHQNLG
jgi:hypothetical protein